MTKAVACASRRAVRRPLVGGCFGRISISCSSHLRADLPTRAGRDRGRRFHGIRALARRRGVTTTIPRDARAKKALLIRVLTGPPGQDMPAVPSWA